MEPQETTAPVLPEPREEGGRMKMLKRVLLGLVPLVLLVLGGAGVLLYSSESEAHPAMTWTPSSLSLEVGAGQSTTTTVTFIPSKDAKNVNVWVVPKLAPYVSVSPASFANVVKGQGYPVVVTVAASSTAPLGVYNGTIHLRQGKKTLARPLPMRVEVVWPTFDGGEELGFALQYPPGWYVTSKTRSVVLRNVEVSSSRIEERLNSESFFQVTRQVGVNPDLLPIVEWVARIDGAYEPVFQEPLNVDGRDAVRIEVPEFGGLRAHVYIADGADVIEVSYGLFAPLFIADYEAMLQDISITE